jgi:hypothetical protein
MQSLVEDGALIFLFIIELPQFFLMDDSFLADVIILSTTIS